MILEARLPQSRNDTAEHLVEVGRIERDADTTKRDRNRVVNTRIGQFARIAQFVQWSGSLRSNRYDVRENGIYIDFFQTMFPVVVGVNGIAVLITPLLAGQTAWGLFFIKHSLLVVEFGLL